MQTATIDHRDRNRSVDSMQRTTIHRTFSGCKKSTRSRLGVMSPEQNTVQPALTIMPIMAADPFIRPCNECG